ncbi:MAG: hypothetical protein M1816_001383 [Peltula sp. TS41687]|nr:MAG: hypothetical protein M1816_001383 [Peltula sp. TS41687]
MQGFLFAPPTVGPRENQRNYVFVDEHNRHKRLKVMRACEGCRRRKIKCDAATTNSWPCSACVRLKLHCVPPSLNYDPDTFHSSTSFEPEQPQSFGVLNGPYRQQQSPPTQLFPGSRTSAQDAANQISFPNGIGSYGTSSFPTQPDGRDASMSVSYPTSHDQSVDLNDLPYRSNLMFSSPPGRPSVANASPESWQSDPYSSENLSDALGELKIHEDGVAPYISQQKKSLAEAPALEEFDEYVRNLPLPTGPDLTVRIPHELMPSEQQALNYFDIFFEHVHPYVPVINKLYFYQQWQTNRDSISPLILEAMFACAGSLSDDPTQGSRWLALAGKHADCFMDVPRLSTLQALLLILKAREPSPKRGYYFRSWMTVVTLIDMAKELGIDEHHGLHREGHSCGSTYNDCVTKTRIWQTLFICELMIGAPQGRSDMTVDIDTVDLGIPRPSPGLDEYDLRISRDWVIMSRMIRTVRLMNDVVAKVKKKKDWGNDPRWSQLTPFFQAWLNELPADLRVMYPSDGSPPWLPSHFVGNLHTYYELSVIMLHRPQLAASESFAIDGDWKRHMMLAYTASKNICRLQEAILNGFGLTGLRCMQRGLGFTIYSVLTCTVLHLVAITSPDQELNADAADYFSRHMRILERCISVWPMPHVRAQIDALREAFSADTSKPFVLKRSFPYSSPSIEVQKSSLYNTPYPTQPRSDPTMGGSQQQQQLDYLNHPISPPLSSGGLKPNGETSMGMVEQSRESQQQQQHSIPTTTSMPMMDTMTWNPSRIFDQWNTAFGTPQTLGHVIPTTPGFPPTTTSPSSSQDLAGPLPPQQLHDPTTPHHQPHHHPAYRHHHQQPQPPQQQQHPTSSNSIPSLPSFAATTTAAPLTAPPPTSFISPSMWQSSVAAVYEGGQQGLLRNGSSTAAPAAATAAGLANTDTTAGSGWDLGNSGMISQIVNNRPSQR